MARKKIKHAGDWINYPDSNIYRVLNKKPSRKIDFDGDRIVNWEDCAPYNPNRQGIWGKIVYKVKDILGIEPKPKELPAAPAGQAYVGTTGGKTVLVSEKYAAPTSTPSGGGGGVSSPGGSNISNATTSTSVSNASTISQSITSVPGTLATTYQIPTATERIKSIPSYVSTNIRSDVPGTIKGTGQILAAGAVSAYGTGKTAYEKIKAKAIGMTPEERETKIEKERRQLESGTREQPFTQSGRGTVMQVSKPYSDEEIVAGIERGTIGEQAGFNELSRREGERYGKKYVAERDVYIQQNLPEVQEKAQASLDTYRDALQQKVNKGETNATEANKLLEKKQESLNTQLKTQVELKAKEFHKKRGVELEKQSQVYLDKLSDKITQAKIIRTAPIIAGLSFAGGTILGASATGTAIVESTPVKAISAGALTYSAAAGGAALYEAGKEGTLTSTKVFNVVAPTLIAAGAGYAGFKVGSAAAAADLKVAVSNSRIVSRAAQEITTEAELYKVEGLTQQQKVQLSEQLRAGRTVSLKTYDIIASSKADQKLINKAFPVKKIVSYEVIDARNNLVYKKSLVKVEISKGKYDYVDYDTGVSSGYYNPETGEITLKSIKVSGKPGKIKEISTAKELIKPKIEYIQDETGNIIGRIIESKTEVFPGEKVKLKGELTQESLKKIGSSKFTETPSRIANTRTYQELVKAEENLIALKINKKGMPLYERDLTFKTVEGIGLAKPISQLPKEVPPAPGLKLQQVYKQISVPSTDFSSQVTKSVQNLAKKITPKTETIISKPPEIKAIQKTSAITATSVIPKISAKEIQKEVSVAAVIPVNKLFDIGITSTTARTTQGLGLKLNQATVEKQIQRLTTVPATPTITTPFIPTDFNIPVMPPPVFPLGNLGAGPQYKPKKAKATFKRTPKYSASLIAAAVQAKPVKVTKKQYQKLSKKVFTGIETRPVLEIVEGKKKKRKVQF